MCAVIKRSIIFQNNPLLIVLFVNVYILLFAPMLSFYPNYDLQFTNIPENVSTTLLLGSLKAHNSTIEQYFGQRMPWNTSNLGSIIFKMENFDKFKKRNKTFKILVWKYWNWLKNRHVFHFNKTSKEDIFADCSVSNCIFTGDDTKIDTVDVVLVHTMHGIIPTVEKRIKSQLWVFLQDESPEHSFHATKNPNLKDWENVFNWSMTYRTISEVPVPYGRTVPLNEPLLYTITNETIKELIPYLRFKQTDVFVAVMSSNCVSFRSKFLKKIQKFIKVDVYGGCSRDNNLKYKCPGHFKADCSALAKYYFYLVIENANCSQYITEKIFQNAYSKGAIPIIVGTFLNDSVTLLPPNSFIHWSDYVSHKQLAEKIISVYKNKEEYTSYHRWRNNFAIRNEHGYLGTKSYHLCRLCEALNYNKVERKIYTFEDLRPFYDPTVSCK